MMASIYRLLILLFLTEQSFAAVSRKPPSFATPIYSNSYLPASMQVIFHTVEQLKAIEDISQNNSSSSTTIIPHEKDVGITISSTTIQAIQPQSSSTSLDQQETSREPNNDHSINQPLTVEETSHNMEPVQIIDQTTQFMSTSSSIGSPNSESSQETSLTFQATGLPIDRQTITTTESELVHHPHVEPLEVNEETPEINYATPEMNHEFPENFTLSTSMETKITPSTETDKVGGIGDNQKDQGLDSTTSTTIRSPIVVEENRGESKINASKRVVRLRQPILKNASEIVQDHLNREKGTIKKKLTLGRRGNEELNKKKPTVDSIVNEIYDIVKPITIPSPLSSSTSSSSIPSSLDDSDDVTLKDTIVKLEVLEEEAEEIRFTLLGEKVAQVPRPSLTSYLRLAKVPPKKSIEQLATLYDALSKDARKQGFGRYAGYSNEVLQILEASSKTSGVAQQMKILFDKIVEKNELTRDETKSKISSVLKELNDSSSSLNQDLKNLRPLTYAF